MDRRAFVKSSLFGAGAASLSLGLLDQTFGGLLPWLGGAPRPSYDAFANLGAGSLGDLALARRWSRSLAPTAFAEGSAPSEWSLVTIKVLNHVFTPLVFAPGRIVNGNTILAPGIVRGSTRGGNAAAFLAASGADRLSDRPRYAALRFNKWFADMLHTGAADGKAANTDFPAGVAIQAFHHLKQIAGQNHALKGTKLRQNLPDLALFAEQNGLVESPLGISALMMGGEYDKAEGAVAANAVLGASDSEAIVVPSRRIADYVGQLRQFVSRSYVSRAAPETNLALKFDRLAADDPKLRRELLASVEAFKGALPRFEDVSALENQRQTFDPARANGQSSVAGTGASFEFQAQCQYVLECLALPGRPLRNFSLFLNVNDLDGKDLDATTNFTAPEQNGSAVRAYTYVEGMRQLALGLNALGRRIALGEKLLVAVVSEGGRGAAMEDSKTAFALVMGPSGAGGLADALYARNAELNREDSVILQDLAAETAQVPWDSPEGLQSRGGSRLDATVATTGDVQMGVAQFLEERTGKSVRGALSEDDGRYALLKRG